MTHSAVKKYGFRIRTGRGLIVDNLLIYGRDEVDAEHKLRQMYQHCKVLLCTVHKPGKSSELVATKHVHSRQADQLETTSQLLKRLLN